MGGRGRVLRASLVAVIFMAFIWFLFVGVLAHRVKTTTITAKSSELLKLIGTKRYGVQFDCDPYYVSKRRVPNGPDPIHNRCILRIFMHITQTHMHVYFCLWLIFFPSFYDQYSSQLEYGMSIALLRLEHNQFLTYIHYNLRDICFLSFAFEIFWN